MKVKMLVVFMFILMGVGQLYAQELTGTVRGVVFDQSGLSIPNTTVSAIGVVKMQVLTDTGGEYALVLPPGEYIVTFESSGFNILQKSVAIRAGGNIVLNATLEISEVRQEVTIEEKVPEIDTGSHTISTTIKSDEQTKIPSGTGYIGLITKAPGVRAEPVGGGFMSDGSSAAENDFFINGVKTSDTETGSLRTTSNFPFEFVEETQIMRMGDAQYGSSLGAVVNGVLKRGANDTHGQIWTYSTFDGINASPNSSLRFSPFDDDKVEYFKNKKDKSLVLAPGYVVGFPVVKDKIFFLSGSRPNFGKTERDVKFLKNNVPGKFESNTRQDSALNKIDLDLLLKNKPLHLSLAHLYSPLRVRGFLPGRDGTDSPDTLWHNRGYRIPSTLILWNSSYFPTNKLALSFFGGWNYTNFKDTYGLSSGPSIVYLTSNIGTDGVPRRFQASAGNFTPNNIQTQKETFKRNNLYLNVSYLKNWRGSHLLDLGFQRDSVQNDSLANTWPDGRFLMAWGARWPGLTGIIAGRYGFYVEDQFETSGQVKSRSQALYFQDKWQVYKNLVINFGVRTESEYIPSFLGNKKAIDFGFKDKIAPRAGIAYDPTGSGKSKISIGFLVSYDVVKYNLPISAFGGDKWLRCFYPLDNPDVSLLKKGGGGKASECINLRVPANDAIDPALKPMHQRMFTVGYERSVGNNWILSIYGIQKQLVRTVEDVGRLVVNKGTIEEQYTITNPGEGRSIDSSWFPQGYPSPITPKAKREYSALELRVDKRAYSYFFSASHTISRLFGNYSGLASSDERGRLSPNTNRDFDLTFMTRDKDANLVYGKLATDRPHVFKFFGSKSLSFRKLGNADLGISFIAQNGTPLSTQVPLLTSTFAFSYGRGDMGRTPNFFETSLMYGHEIKLKGFKEQQKIRIEFAAANLFNQKTALDKVTELVHPNDGQIHFSNSSAVFQGYDPKALMKAQDLRLNPAYGMVSAFQTPRTARIALRFFF